MNSTSLKVLSKGVFTITSVRADAARRKANNGTNPCGKNDSESSQGSEHGSLPRRVSTPELLRHVATVANIKVKILN